MRKLKLPGRDRSRPRLDENDVELIRELGLEKIREQARQIVEEKLREQPETDGYQTPTAGNPVYKALHACKAASRQDLSRAHRIPAGKDLTDSQVESVVNLAIRWIVREYNFFFEEKQRQQRSLSDF